MDGLLKATIDKSTQRILGCTILAAEAGEMICTVQALMIAEMPATTLRDAVFDRFFRADQVRVGTMEGAGLGLSIVQSICTAHGGFVKAENHE
jgi:signal transduction histidine kinase